MAAQSSPSVSLISIVAVFSYVFVGVIGNNLARGWGDGINWMTLEDGLKISSQLNKPIMLIIHKSWCGACKALKPKFSDTKEIVKLSEKFVMVNVEDEEEASGPQYSPDGAYIPRILFLGPNGTVRTEFVNERGNAQYKFYYPSPDDIVSTMERVLDKVSREIEQTTDEL